jgi:phosphoglycerate dehydrogenase-like enzyme
MTDPTAVVVGPLLSAPQRAQLEGAGAAVIVSGAEDPAVAEELPDGQLAAAEAWLGRGLSPELLGRMPRLRWLHAPGAGVDHYLFPELVDSPVVVTSIRRRHSTTADHALTLLLALARDLPEMIRQQERRQWRLPGPDRVAPVAGSRVVIIGTGQVGTAFARRVAALGAIPVGVSRRGRPAEGFTETHPSAGLRDAVRDARWVVNCCPLTRETAGLVSAEVFAAMDPAAVFVSVGRGGTVDQAALTDSLRRGSIAAAALDVFEDEPLPPESELWAMPNCLITPHAAGVIPGVDGVQLLVDSFLGVLGPYRRGETLGDAINKAEGY